MAGETTTTKTAAKAAGKASDTDNQAASPGDAGQTGSAADGQPAGAVTGAGAGAPQASTAQPPDETANAQRAAAAPAPAQRKPVAIEVISRRDGFWRGDRQWTIAPRTVPLSELSKKQLAEINDEPLLIVRDVYEDGR